jgi:replication factor A2
MEDKVLIDNREVTQVRVVGQVLEFSVANTGKSHTMKLDDGTAHTEVTVWLHDEGNEAYNYHNAKKGEWRQGIYVEVFGKIKVLSAKQNKRVIMADRVIVVTDFNLVTHHYLQCIYAHLHQVKGLNVGHHIQQVVGGFNPFTQMNQPAPKVDYSSNPYHNAIGGAEDNTKPENSPLAQAIVEVLRGPIPHGITFEDLCSKLPHHDSTAIQNTLHLLQHIGSVYTGKDDNHFKA